jgi:hypothetical protein
VLQQVQDGTVPDSNANADILGAMEDGAQVVRMSIFHKQTGRAI